MVTTRAGARLPTPPGPHGIGLRRLDFTAAGRRIQAYVWYPATIPPGAPARPYHRPAESDAFAGSLVALGLPEAADRAATGIGTHSVEDAPPAAGAWPLVVFNHGGALDPLRNFSLMEHLASAGYVACSIGHAGESAGLVWTDGSTTPIAPSMLALTRLAPEALHALVRFHVARGEAARRARLVEFRAEDPGAFAALAGAWSQDSLALVDRLHAGGPEPGFAALAPHVDRDRLGYAGMSLGGAATLDCCMADPRARAGINLDGLIWNFAHLDRAVPTAFLQLAADPASNLAQLTSLLPGVDLAIDDGEAPVANDLFYEPPESRGAREDIVRLTLAGVDHMGFTDGALLDRLRAGEDPRDVPILLVNRLCVAFLDWTLRGGPSAPFEAILRSSPGVRRERTRPSAG